MIWWCWWRWWWLWCVDYDNDDDDDNGGDHDCDNDCHNDDVNNMMMMMMTQVCLSMKNILRAAITRVLNQFHLHRSACRIQKRMLLWYSRHVRRRRMEVRKKVGGNMFNLVMFLRISRKRRAVAKFKSFLMGVQEKAKVIIIIITIIVISIIIITIPSSSSSL